ncbi:MAG: GmrSD restriction endonuclease domain-containing protein [Ilumatobacteraceae bacterium]
MKRVSSRRVAFATVASLGVLVACGSGEESALEKSLREAITTTPTSQPATTIVANTSSETSEPAASSTVEVSSDSTNSSATVTTSPVVSETTATVSSSVASSPVPVPTTTPATMLPTTTQLLDPVGLRIEAEHPDGYNRDLFRHWIDADGDGCDTRKEVLIAESLDPVQTGSQCAILSGRWYSIYDNTETTDSSRFDIDHVVALKEAWDSGAWNWTADQRRDFANDLSQSYFLIAVSASSNRSKSDRDPAEWMPTNTSYRCEYVRIWVQVKRAWNLSVDQAENDAIRNTLAAC